MGNRGLKAVASGAGTGASVGGAIGSGFGGVGSAVGGAVGAGVGAIAGGIGHAIAAQKRNKRIKDMMARGDMGQAERDQKAAAAEQSAARQAAALQSRVQAQQMAAPGTMSGYYADTQRKIAGAAGEAGAKARTSIDALAEYRRSQAQQQASADEQRMLSEEDESRDYWAQFAEDEALPAAEALGNRISSYMARQKGMT